MYDEQDLNTYATYLLDLAIIHDDELYKEMNTIYDIDNLKLLRALIKSFSNDNYLSDKVKKNIYNIVQKGREIQDENRKERYEILNDIVAYTNRQEIDESFLFYRVYLYMRTNDRKFLKEYTNEQIEEDFELEERMSSDFMVIFSHSKFLNEESFNNIYLNMFSNYKYYFESVNNIVSDHPEILEDTTFKNRYKRVLENSNMKEIKTNKKYIKKISKQKR